MSCRVLKRDMELAMLDELVKAAKKLDIKVIIGHYLPTLKNSMVKNLFGRFGFEKICEDSKGNTDWRLETAEYTPKNTHIAVNMQ